MKPSDVKRPSKLWWLLAIMIFMVCVLIQLPISWIMQGVMPNNPYIQWTSGNIYKGSATWQTGQANSVSKSLGGKIHWQWKPTKIFVGKLSADVKISTGKTKLKGEMNAGIKSSELAKLSGRIDKETLVNMIDIQLPDIPIQVNNITIKVSKSKGFDTVDGQMTWVGGQVGYPHGGQIQKINAPSMKMLLTTEQKNNDTVLYAHLVDKSDKTLGKFYLDKQGMIDINLMQRLLENAPSYTGKAPQDTPVVSIRQPIQSLGQ